MGVTDMANSLEMIEKETKQYIVVKIGSEQYGIDINYIDNIVRMQKITRVPKVQSYFNGVINLRGEVIPVMSLRVKMDLPKDEFSNSTRIIIIKLEPQASIGIIVDEVKEVVTLEEAEIEKVLGQEGSLTIKNTAGEEIAKNLLSLYVFFNKELMNANMTLNKEKIQSVCKMMSDLRDSWVQAEATTTTSVSDLSPAISITG